MDPILIKLRDEGEDWNALNYLEILHPEGDLGELVNDPDVMAKLPAELTDRSLLGQLARKEKISIAQAAERLDSF